MVYSSPGDQTADAHMQVAFAWICRLVDLPNSLSSRAPAATPYQQMYGSTCDDCKVSEPNPNHLLTRCRRASLQSWACGLPQPRQSLSRYLTKFLIDLAVSTKSSWNSFEARADDTPGRSVSWEYHFNTWRLLLVQEELLRYCHSLTTAILE